VRDVYANEVFDLICESAWEIGDPGIIYIDEIERCNPTPKIGKIESTNPCGEQPLLPYESCNLGSINLTKIIENGKINWEKLEKIIEISVRFLDDVIDVNNYPIPEIERITKANRKIGLGIMGWADLLLELKIPYGSQESFILAEELMKFINEKAFEYSVLLGREKGSFPNFEKSIYYGKIDALRNATRTTIAPTGSISIIANCSSGIEPIFGVAFIRNILEGTKFLEINPVFEKIAKEEGFLSSSVLKEIIKTGSLKNVNGVPEEYKKIFLTALDIPAIVHLKMESIFQKYTDNAVSKTVNLPFEATIEDVKEIFINGWKMKCKGITVFRYGSKESQVLSYGESIKEEIDYLVLPDEISSCSKGICIY
ncbi:MAG: adenosylcobalamin-dependent ribonucleoside-diphosphate reductase, partial [Candidatus Ratteibacteria bacterium]